MQRILLQSSYVKERKRDGEFNFIIHLTEIHWVNLLYLTTLHYRNNNNNNIYLKPVYIV
jgi:hypothetical protein